MSTTEQVKAALAALLRDRPPGIDGDDPAATVAAAERAFTDVERAAAWIADGEDRLEVAVGRASTRGDVSTADRGRRLLDVLSAYRSAAEATGSANRFGDRTNSSAGSADHCAGSSDYFRRGRTTLLGGDGLRSDR